MVFKKLIVVDARSHLLGRLASVVAKELLSGQRVVRLLLFLVPIVFLFRVGVSDQVIVRSEETNISGSFFRNKRTFEFIFMF